MERHSLVLSLDYSSMHSGTVGGEKGCPKVLKCCLRMNILAIVILCLLVPLSGSQDLVQECPEESGVDRAMIDQCLSLGHDFLGKYSHFLKRSIRRFKTFDFCG